jgi:predicted DNA-binding transcriptional regulator AlpA
MPMAAHVDEVVKARNAASAESQHRAEQADGTPLLSSVAAAEFVGVSRSHFEQLAKRHGLKRVKPRPGRGGTARKTFWSLADIVILRDARRAKPVHCAEQPDGTRVLSTRAARDFLGVSLRHFYRLVRRHRLKPAKQAPRKPPSERRHGEGHRRLYWPLSDLTDLKETRRADREWPQTRHATDGTLLLSARASAEYCGLPLNSFLHVSREGCSCVGGRPLAPALRLPDRAGRGGRRGRGPTKFWRQSDLELFIQARQLAFGKPANGAGPVLPPPASPLPVAGIVDRPADTPRMEREAAATTTDIAALEASTPPLDEESGKWVTNKEAAVIDAIEVRSLAVYRSNGAQTSDRMFGVDSDGRIWRRARTPGSHPWYLRSSLRAEAKTVNFQRENR